jgi:hypothetical protein
MRCGFDWDGGEMGNLRRLGGGGMVGELTWGDVRVGCGVWMRCSVVEIRSATRGGYASPTDVVVATD